MSHSDTLTQPANRPITKREIEVVDWMLVHGSLGASLDHLRQGLRDLRVVARCGCGCASVDFVAGGQSAGARRIAEAVARDSRGRACGVILWALDDQVSGLEVYEQEPGSATEIPATQTLRQWHSG
jgi:hypothetical protein